VEQFDNNIYILINSIHISILKFLYYINFYTKIFIHFIKSMWNIISLQSSVSFRYNYIEKKYIRKINKKILTHYFSIYKYC